MSDQDAWLTDSLLDVALERATAVQERDLHQSLLSFLAVLDSLDRIVSSTPEMVEQPEAGPPTSFDRLRTVRRQLLVAFERSGVTFFECVGQPFDPTLHEAVEVVHRDDVEEDTIVEEISRGCAWRGQVLRFARVVVACRPESNTQVNE